MLFQCHFYFSAATNAQSPAAGIKNDRGFTKINWGHKKNTAITARNLCGTDNTQVGIGSLKKR
jgi:hypothetical protein